MNKTTLSVLIAISIFIIAMVAMVIDGGSKLDLKEDTSVQEDTVIEDKVNKEIEDDDIIIDEVDKPEQETPDIEQILIEDPQSNESSQPESTIDEVSESPEIVIDDEQSIDNEIVENPATSSPITEEEVVEEAIEVEEEEEIVVVPVQSDLVGHWTFNDGLGLVATDVSGNNNIANLMHFDPVTSWITGQIDGALKFDGIDDYATIQHSDTLNLGMVDQSYTISFWYMNINKPKGERQIIGKGARSGASPFIIRINKSGYPSLRISDGLQAPTIIFKQSIASTGRWHHVVAVRNAAQDNIRLYVDGKEDGLPVPDTTNGSLENDLNIIIDRYEGSGSSLFYNAFSIDDVQIYNRAFSSTEINDLFTTGKAGG